MITKFLDLCHRHPIIVGIIGTVLYITVSTMEYNDAVIYYR